RSQNVQLTARHGGCVTKCKYLSLHGRTNLGLTKRSSATAGGSELSLQIFCFETRSFPRLARCYPSQLYLLCRSSRSLHSNFTFLLFMPARCWLQRLVRRK